jgi:hypothetical protein
MKIVALASMTFASAFLAAGCNTATNEPANQQSPQAAQSAAASRPVITSPVSINAEMVSLVDHAAHELWSVEREGGKPKNQGEWENLSEHATQLAASGALIVLPGTGPNDVTNTQQAKWQKWAKDLSDAGLAELKATEDNNLEALLAANNRLVDVCEGCHKEFKPTLPSEGIVHKHMHTTSK